MAKVEDLIGKTLSKVAVEQGGLDNDEIVFTCDDGVQYTMRHDQDCCEGVTIEDICGDIKDLVGSPILLAEEVTHIGEDPEGVPHPGEMSFTWTFYKFATMKGYITIRWYGESNGYYSEDVSFKKDE